MSQLDFSKQADPVAAAPAALDFSGNAEPVEEVSPLAMAGRKFVSGGGRLLNTLDSLGTAINPGNIVDQALTRQAMEQAAAQQHPSALPADWFQRSLAADFGPNPNLAEAQSLFEAELRDTQQRKADQQAIDDAIHPLGGLARNAIDFGKLATNEVSSGKVADVAGGVAEAVPQLAAAIGTGGESALPEMIPAAVRAVPGFGALLAAITRGAPTAAAMTTEQATNLPDDMTPLQKVEATAKAAGINTALAGVPGAVGSSPLVRTGTGAALGYGTSAAQTALEGGPQDQTQNLVGAFIGAALGGAHVPERAPVMDPHLADYVASAPEPVVPKALPGGADYSAKAEPVRPVAPDLGGAVHVSPAGEAVTPQQGASAFSQAVQAGMAPQPARLPSPVVTVDRSGTAVTNADANAAAAQQQAAVAERQALGITPDIERSQGVRWSQRDQQVREETARQQRLGELDKAIATREAQAKPARGVNAKPDESVDDALTFLAKSGGLDRRTFVKEGVDPAVARSPENRTRGGASRPLFRAQDGGGLSLDDAARILWQHGYIPEHDNHAALDLIMEGVNQDKATHSIHHQDQGDLLALEQSRKDVAEHQVPDYGDVPFSFAGERAQTADRGALTQAQQMEAMGRDSVPDRFGNQPGSPEDTHVATGWHRGVDGKWRFEIDDSTAKVDAAPLKDMAVKVAMIRDLRMRRQDANGRMDAKAAGEFTQRIVKANADYENAREHLTLGKVLQHPALFKAYPELADTRVKIDPDMSGWAAYDGRDIVIRAPGSYPTEGNRSLKSVLLHELQHAIQHREGFARGGNATEARTLPEFEQMVRQKIEANDGKMPSWTEVQPSNEAIEDDAAHAVYRRLAGEVEARNTQRRMNLDAGERRALPPSETADTPRHQQIVRFNGGDAHDAGEPHADQQAIAKYAAKLSSYIGKAIDIAPAAHVPDATRRALAAFDDAFGSRSIVVRNGTPDALDFNGVTLRDGVRLINEDATSPVLTVAGHEMIHQLRADAPELYAELADEVKRQGRLDAYAAVLNARARASGEGRDVHPELIAEELAADAAGDALSDPDFIEKLAQRNPGLFRKLAARLMDFLARVSRKLRSLGSSPFLDDVDAYRAKLADVLERYASRQHGSEASTPEDPAFQRVFHGTPHTVDKFSLQKIGTGEGAQAYGWGMYFASERAIAEHYRKTLSGRNINSLNDAMAHVRIGGERISDKFDVGMDRQLVDLAKAGDQVEARQFVRDNASHWDELARDESYPHRDYAKDKAAAWGDLARAMEGGQRLTSTENGNLYHVEVPEDHDLLDWDKPLSQQPEKVRDVLLQVIEDAGGSQRYKDDTFLAAPTKAGGSEYQATGRMLYQHLAAKLGTQGASEYLNSHGIPGLRYLDGNSRSKGEGSANYVIWDENAIGSPEAALSRKPVADQTDTPAFRKWFGDSKVVDAEGKPLVVYHVTTAPKFEAFDRAFASDAQGAKLGHFFTTDKDFSERYANGGNGRRYEQVYLSIENPVTVDDLSRYQRADQMAKQLAEWRDEGHDGALVKGYDGENTWVAFDAAQIKSATDNAGTFDGDNPSILFSRKPVDTEHMEDMPSRRPGESQAAYLRRITRKNGADIKAATTLATTQRKLGRYGLRGMMATQARQMAIADAAMNEARKTFDKTPDVINYASVHEWETGKRITDPDFRHFVDTMQHGFDQRIAEIQRLAPGAMESLIEHYMPHMYEDTGKAAKWYQNALGKRPLSGDKSFLKQREWPTLKEAMASGLKPISPNPVDWVLMKYAQMDKFIGLLKLQEDFKRRGWLMKLEPGQRAPEGFTAVDDPAFRIAGGLQGQFVVPDMIAKDINNYLTPGLSKYGAWRTLRGMQNAVVSWNLGWSAFHAGFTSVDNAVTHGAVGLQRLADGDIAGGLMALVKAVPTMVTSPFEGGKLNKQWTGQAQTDPNTAALLDLLEQGGARMKMGNASAEYNNALPQVMRTIRRLQAPGAIPDALERLHRQVLTKGAARAAAEAGWGSLKGAGRALSAVGETGSFLIHHVLVPNQKMAARVTLLKFELDRYAKQLGKQRGDYAGIVDVMHPDVAKQLASDVVDKVDFRLGQMTYDNFFYPKILREISQALVMAPGWQAGAYQTMTGGLKDLGRFVKPEKLVAPLDKAGTIHDAHRGRFTNNVANLAMLFLMVGGGNALYQWLVSGIKPDSMKDLVGPRTGRKNADDSDERIVPPSYMKDHYEFFHHPVDMASHKLHPMLRMMWEIAHNEDYFGNMIRDPHHGLGKQAVELAGYLGKSMLPFTATNAAKVSANGGGLGQHAANFIGITPAAASLARSEFQSFVAKGGQRGWDYPAATPAEAEYQDRMRKADNALRTGQTPDLTGLTEHDVAKLKKRTQTPKPELQFDRLSLEDKLDAYELATPEERERYRLTEVLRSTRPQRSVTFRRLPAEEQRAILARLEDIARGH